MLILTPRLSAVAGYVLPGQPLADVGTDHAYLPAWLVGAGRVPRAIATDLMPGPLEAARATVVAEGLTDRIDLRLGSGLGPVVPGEAVCATICGMGGALIATILAAGPLGGIHRLVLQPMGGEERLREWLCGSGWRLVDEALVEDGGRIYAILVAEPGCMTLTPTELVAGPFLLQKGGPLLARYAGILLQQARRARAGAGRSERPQARERVDLLEDRIRLWEEVVARAESNGRPSC